MGEQFKLRLRDGTILGVDHDGLRTWLLDDRAMVQSAGSRGWRPLRETLAILERERAAAVVRRPEPPPPEPTPQVALPLVPPPPRAPQPPAVIAPPPQIVSTPQALTTIADSIAPDSSSSALEITTRDEAMPIIPFKPIEEEEEEAFYVANAPAAVQAKDQHAEAAPPGPSLLDVASAEVELHAPDDRPWQWTRPEPREVLGAENSPGIALKPLDDEEELEELELFEEEDAKTAVPSAPMALREMFAWAGPLASGWRDQVTRRVRPVGLTPARMKRAVLITGAAAAVVVAVSTVSMWVSGRMSSGVSQSSKATPVPPTPPHEAPPELPRDVQAVMDQAPHLAPGAIQLLLSTSTSYGVPDAPEVFRRAYVAAERGTASLSEEEARELRGLTKSVLAVLGQADRKRVLAYGRLSSGRHLLASEDRRVLELFARGVRTLPTTHRERLQTLTGKAIAAAVTPPTPPTN